MVYKSGNSVVIDTAITLEHFVGGDFRYGLFPVIIKSGFDAVVVVIAADKAAAVFDNFFHGHRYNLLTESCQSTGP